MGRDNWSIQAKAGDHLFARGFAATPSDVGSARGLLGNVLNLPGHPSAELQSPIRWGMNPFHDRNWQFHFHSLRWADSLRRAYEETGDEGYRLKHLEILTSWYRDNASERRTSSFAWYDMSAGLRCLGIAGAVHAYKDEDFLLEMLHIHGERLAEPGFGAQKGNHALHVSIGLVVTGHILGNEDWLRQGFHKIVALLTESVDPEGVDLEGAIQYQINNFRWYKEASRHLEAVGIDIGPELQRVDKMPGFLADATASTGWPVQFGDSDPTRLPDLHSAVLDYARTRGVSGTVPSEVFRVYTNGYVFGRNHWHFDAVDPMMFYSVRHGPSTSDQPHAHNDGASVTLTYGDTELLCESGRYKYDQSNMSLFLKSERAHNSVSIDSDPYNANAPTLLAHAHSTKVLDVTVLKRVEEHGSQWTRAIIFLREHSILLVADSVRATTSSRITQRWQLPEESEIAFSENSARIRSGSTYDLSVEWYGDTDLTMGSRCGQESPRLEGWRSVKHGSYFPAPVLEISRDASTMDIVTVLRPIHARGFAEPTSFETTSNADAWLEGILSIPTGSSAQKFHLMVRPEMVTCSPV